MASAHCLCAVPKGALVLFTFGSSRVHRPAQKKSRPQRRQQRQTQWASTALQLACLDGDVGRWPPPPSVDKSSRNVGDMLGARVELTLSAHAGAIVGAIVEIMLVPSLVRSLALLSP